MPSHGSGPAWRVGTAAQPLRALLDRRTSGDRRRSRSELEYLAFRDPVTGLPNRWLFQDRIAQAVLRSQRQGDLVALLFLDLDGFKEVNDRHGHEFGDRLLGEVAARLVSGLRECDTAARLGGDEFAVILDGLTRPAQAASLAERLLGCIARPVTLGEHSLGVTVSIGIALWSQDGLDVGDLIRKADVAMYRAKEAGGSCVRFYSYLSALVEATAVESEKKTSAEREF